MPRWTLILLSLLVPAALQSTARAAPIPSWDPATTWVLVAGVVRWRDPSLERFDAHHRKDLELMAALTERGVPEPQRKLLIDGQATRASVLTALDFQVATAPPGATFIVYFEGHGLYDDAHQYVLATSDTRTERLDRTGLPIASLLPLLAVRGPTDRVLLLGDACYSGHLAAIALGLSYLGVPAVALTSANEVSASSENWTYTQALIDALRGRAIIDRDRNGRILMSEVAEEARSAMRYREGQPIGFAPIGFADLDFGPAAPWPADQQALEMKGDVFARGDWVVARRLDGERGIARVIGARREEDRPLRLRLEYYDYTDRAFGWAREDRADPVMFYVYPVGTRLKVEADEVEYSARVIRVEDGMHLVHFEGWLDPEHDADAVLPDDEFVTPDQIMGLLDAALEASQRVLVEDQGDLYEAVIKGRFNGEVCLRYPGSPFVQDDCVPESRVSRDTRAP